MERAVQVLKGAGLVALDLLRAVAAASDAFPPLKSAAAGTIYIVDLIKDFKSNKEKWIDFGQHVTESMARITRMLPDAENPVNELEKSMIDLSRTLHEIGQEIESIKSLSTSRSFVKYRNDPEKIAELKKKFDDALGLFQLSASLTTGLAVLSLSDKLDIKQLVDRISDRFGSKVDEVLVNSALRLLPYVEGASWSPEGACLTGTRVAILEDIEQWIEEGRTASSAGIYLVSGVVGAGKTAIANSVAQRCLPSRATDTDPTSISNPKAKLLASCFFFNRSIEGRNGPQKLFSTIAFDLSKLDKSLAADIAVLLEEDRSLASASQTIQFEELILQPFLRIPIPRNDPIVIVIDGLDEGADWDTFEILRDKVPKLPGLFRIVVTSRPTPDVMTALLSAAHVRITSLQLDESVNKGDINLYINAGLADVAIRRGLGSAWPGVQMTADLVERAGGLFVWAATILNYLRSRTTTYPDKKLKQIVAATRTRGLDAETKMVNLYSQIFLECNWNDPDFVHGYRIVVGSILVLKIPLGTGALSSMLRRTDTTIDIAEVLGPLYSFFGGVSDDSQPIRVLHASFHEYVLFLAPAPFRLDESEHNESITLQCLTVLNDDLSSKTPGTGYLTDSSTEGIPALAKSAISDELQYASRFWLDHIVNIRPPVPDAVCDALRQFLSTKFVLWLEILCAGGRFLGFDPLQSWLQAVQTSQNLGDVEFDPDHAANLTELGEHLSYMDRLEESAEAITQSVKIYKGLTTGDSLSVDSELADSLRSLSWVLSKLGHYSEALPTSEESLALYRVLAAKDPAKFNPCLAMALGNISRDFYELRRYEEAFNTIEESLALYRVLAAEHPTRFAPDLAMALGNISRRLFRRGRPEEGLAAVEESLALYQVLAAEQPAKFNEELAMVLNNFAKRLGKLGRHEEALLADEKALALRRELVTERPAEFNPYLARSLYNISNDLARLGRDEEALAAMEEAVAMSRALATQRPTKFNPDLADALGNLSSRLAKFGRNAEALAATQESLALYRELATARPAQFNQEVARLLNNLSIDLSKLGRDEEARAAKEEAQLYKTL